MSLYPALLCHWDGNYIKEADGYKTIAKLAGILCLFHNAGLHCTYVQGVYPGGIQLP